MSKRLISKRSPAAAIKRQLRLIVELMRDARVPLWMRAIPVLGLLYLISPIELLPDFSLLPFGVLDDLIVILVCLTIFMAIVPKAVVDDHVSWIDAADITVDDLQEARRRLPPGGKQD